MILYDSMSRNEKELKISKNEVVRIFVCGPTVQDSFHLGHARTYVFFDTFVKYLRSSGYSVFYLQNITDIDDKIINRAREENVQYDEISEKYSREFFRVMKLLRIDSVNFYAFATKHIQEIINQVSTLIKKGYAYEAKDGVYFRVNKFSEYGKLSGQDMESLKAGARVESSEEKEDPRDFVLWKKEKPGEPSWTSPWGKGRPGWHIEDTAITEKYFGEVYEIHGGGTDLVFPHHEAEIAIERSISGKKQLAGFWIHSAMINVNEEKMSKSLHNFVTIENALADFRPEELRYALLNVQFRSVMSFSEEIMLEARSNVNTINILYRKLKKMADGKRAALPAVNSHIKVLTDSLESGFDLRAFFTGLLQLVSKWNNNLGAMSPEEVNEALRILEWVDGFAGILIPADTGDNTAGLVDLSLKIRKYLREKKDFDTSDMIRAGLRELGIYIEDRGDETTWWKE